MDYSFLFTNGFLAIGIIGICILTIVFYIYAKNKEHKETISDNQLKIIGILALIFAVYYVLIYDPKPKLIQNMFLTVVNTGSNINFSAIPKGFYLVLIIAVLIVFYFAHKKSVSSKSSAAAK